MLCSIEWRTLGPDCQALDNTLGAPSQFIAHTVTDQWSACASSCGNHVHEWCTSSSGNPGCTSSSGNTRARCTCGCGNMVGKTVGKTQHVKTAAFEADVAVCDELKGRSSRFSLSLPLLRFSGLVVVQHVPAGRLSRPCCVAVVRSGGRGGHQNQPGQRSLSQSRASAAELCSPRSALPLPTQRHRLLQLVILVLANAATCISAYMRVSAGLIR